MSGIVERLRNATARFAFETVNDATVRRNKSIADATDTITDLLAALEISVELLECAEIEHFAKRTARLKNFTPAVRKIKDTLAKAKGGAS